MTEDTQKSLRRRPARQSSAKLGRPSKYHPKFARLMEEHFAEQELEKIILRSGAIVYKLGRFPTFEGFALKIGASSESLYTWATELRPDGRTPLKPEFAHAYSRAKLRQQDLLQMGSLCGAYQPQIAVLGLKTFCGWKDRVEAVEKVEYESPSEEELNAIYEQGVKRCAILNAKVGRDNNGRLLENHHASE